MTVDGRAGSGDVASVGGDGRGVRALWGRVSAVVAASDPGLSRLRTAATTLTTLVVAAGVLVGVATLLGQPVTGALPGVVVAMIATIAVNEPTPGRRTLSTLALVPAAAGTASLGAALGGHPSVGIVVFVAVAVAAVFAQRLGPRGVAVGMVGFIAYFLVMFLRLPVAQIPLMIGSIVLGAGISLGMRTLLRTRHPDRELRRMLSALTVRSAAVLDTLADAVREQAVEARTTGRLRPRLGRASQTASLVENRLDGAEEPLLVSISNDALSVRVFDFQLGLEHLTGRIVALASDPDVLGPAREEVAGHLDALRAALVGDDRSDPHRWDRLVERLEAAQQIPAPGTDAADRQVVRLRHTLIRIVGSWRRAVAPAELTAPGARDEVEPGPGSTEEGGTAEEDDTDRDDASDDGTSPPVSETVRRAVQVGVATALAIGVGELLSPTRWFWAVIAAFVVFIGASSRGQVLSKGWQRVVGTVAGVFVGVMVAVLVGHNTVLAVVLIAVCLFLGLYLMAVASGLMMFFITTLLALVYGLLGQFSVDLLVLRLEETAAGAAIGVAVSFLLLPTRTRPAVATATADFLGDLREVLDDAAATLTDPDPDLAAGTGAGVDPGPAPARALRDSYAGLRTAAKPLTDGVAGVTGRTGFQRTLHVTGACEYHARALARLAHRHPGVAAAPATRHALQRAVTAVAAHVQTLRDTLDDTPPDGTGDTDVVGTGTVAGSPEAALGDLDDAAREAGRADPAGVRVAPPRGVSTKAVVAGAAGHLRAIDEAVAELAAHLTDTSTAAQSMPGRRLAAAG